MGSVAEGLIRGMAAAAQADRRTPSETKLLALLIHHFKFTFDA
jgi:hypothetical protein